jgi:hypothetical protein
MACNTTRPLLLAACLVATSCGVSSADVRAAKLSGYDTDFAAVYQAALAATRDLYPELFEDARTGVIKTAWHPIRITPETTQTSQLPGASLGRNPGAVKRYYVRFTVRVVGVRPWRVRVDGQASHFVPGGTPAPLTGSDVPTWLVARTDALLVDIHQRLAQFAVKLKEEAPRKHKEHIEITELEPSKYENLPPAAFEVVRAVHRFAQGRELSALRTRMTDEFAFSYGGASGSAEVALAVWQADAGALPELVRILEAGCRPDPALPRVTCPPEFQYGKGFRGYRAGFEKKGAAWKLAFFFTDG